MMIKQNTMKKKMPQASPRLLHGTQSHWFFKIQIFQMIDSSKILQVFSSNSLGTISLAAAMRFAMVFSLSQVFQCSLRQPPAVVSSAPVENLHLFPPNWDSTAHLGCFARPEVGQHLLDLDRSGIKSKIIEEHKVKHWP